jgi:hypothetical protein
MYMLIYIQPSIPPDTNVHINIHTTVLTTRYQCTCKQKYNRPYHQITIYILTYIQPYIPSDTNVHINIHTIVHTTIYQCTIKPFPLNLMYLPIDYNCFVNQLYHKTKIICNFIGRRRKRRKRVTCKKKQGDFNFSL